MSLLPKDLQRFAIDGPNVAPQYIKSTPAVIQLLEQILDCFRFSPDDTYGELCSALEPLCQQSQRHRLIRGIIHILEARLTFDEDSKIDPILLREHLFQMAAKVSAEQFSNLEWRNQIIQSAAEKFQLTPEQIENAIYSDLKDERQILAFEDIEPEELISEYNLTLAKSLLLYAKKLSFTVELGNSSAQSLRRLFQSLRFFNLLFEAQTITETIWQFSVDGPTSVLPQPQKYAASLASFLPILFGFKAWHATSELMIDEKSVTWQLKPDDFQPPEFHIPERIPEEAQQLSRRIVELDPEWEITHDYPILQFGPQAVWIPDFSMRNTQTNATAHVEVLGFWRGDYLNRRLKLLASAPENLILVLSDKLKLDSATLQKTKITIITYKRTPRPQDVLAAAKKCAQLNKSL